MARFTGSFEKPELIALHSNSRHPVTSHTPLPTRPPGHDAGGRLFLPHTDRAIVVAIASLLTSLVGFWYYRNINAVAYVGASTFFLLFAALDAQAQKSGNDVVRTYLAWASMFVITGAVLIFPDFTMVGLLALVDALLRSLSPTQSSRGIVLTSSLLTLSLALVMVISSEGTKIGVFREGLTLFTRFEADMRAVMAEFGWPIAADSPPISISITQAVLVSYFTAAILLWLRLYYLRYTATIREISRANEELSGARQRLQQSVLERTKLLEISRTITMPEDMTLLLGILVNSLRDIIDFGCAAIYTIEGTALRIIFHEGLLPESDALRTHMLAHPKYGAQILDMPAPIVVSDLREVAPTIDGSLLLAPLIIRGQYRGFLALRHHEPNRYDAQSIDVCMGFANQVAGAIDAAQLREAAGQALIIDERSRLARELHDSVSQSLYGIVLGTRTALHQIGAAPQEARVALEYSSNLAGTALAQVRALIFTLRPERLETIGIVKALQAQIDLIHTHTSTQIRFEANPTEPQLSLVQKETFYRIAIEAIQAAVRDRQSATVVLRLNATDGETRLTIEDDGIALSTTPAPELQNVIRGLHERAAAIQASFHVEPIAERGMRMCITAPRPDAAHAL